jgi:hypothetical protein
LGPPLVLWLVGGARCLVWCEACGLGQCQAMFDMPAAPAAPACGPHTDGLLVILLPAAPCGESRRSFKVPDLHTEPVLAINARVFIKKATSQESFSGVSPHRGSRPRVDTKHMWRLLRHRIDDATRRHHPTFPLLDTSPRSPDRCDLLSIAPAGSKEPAMSGRALLAYAIRHAGRQARQAGEQANRQAGMQAGRRAGRQAAELTSSSEILSTVSALHGRPYT